MTGHAWLTGGFAALMIATAACCAGRLVISRLQGRATELDTDAVHVLMGVAMAGMLEPQLGPVPAIAWRAVFATAAAWFAWQAIRPGGRAGAMRCAHPAPHAVESAAMVYMLLPAGSRPSGRGSAMAMPGMSGAATVGNPAVTLLLALFMLGYILWAIDRLTALSRARSAATASTAAAGGPSLVMPMVPGSASVPGTPGLRGTTQAAATTEAGAAERSALAPRLAASFKITMGVAMGYMLITML